MKSYEYPYAQHCAAYRESNCDGCEHATRMDKNNYITALAMHSGAAIVKCGDTNIPVLITKVDSVNTPFDGTETKIVCRVVNHDELQRQCAKKIEAAFELARAFTPAVDPFAIERVIFNYPATIVFWANGEKTTVVDKNAEAYDAHTDLALCLTLRKIGITNITFDFPETKATWEDGTKTVVTCQDSDNWSKETGLFTVIAKKMLGNKGNFNDIFHKWISEEE